MKGLNLIRKKKQTINKILKAIEQTNDNEKKYKLYIQILKIDNTDRNIVLKYLLLAKQIRKVTDKEDNPVVQIMSYINHFPPEQFNKEFAGFGKKEKSSMEKLLTFLDEILSKNWIETTYEEREKAVRFFLNAKLESKTKIKNTSPITWENDELYVFYLYKEFLSQFIKKMEYYQSLDIINYNDLKSEKINKCNENIKNMEDSLKNTHNENFVKEKLQLIEKEKEIRKTYLFIEGKFFENYLCKFNFFLYAIKDTYLKKLSTIKFVTKEDKSIFDYFMLFISHYNFEKMTKNKCLVWSSSFIDSENNKKKRLIDYYKNNDPPMEIIFENENTLKLRQKNMKEIVINNCDDYELESLLNNIYDNRKYNEVEAIEYVKITKINDHLYIKKIFDKWITFNTTIFTSETIVSLYKILFNKQYFLLELEELIILLNNIIFYVFDSDFAAMTNRETMKIYVYGNYGNLINIYDKNISNEDILKVVFLAFNIIVNLHEILGYFNIGYQIYSFGQDEKENYDSPIISKDLSSDYAQKRGGNKESGENIEINLFGRVISDLTVKEALFILNPSNYIQNNFNSFKSTFMKCNEKKINIEQVFCAYLETFKINPKNLLIAENKRYSFCDLIKKKSFNATQRFNMKRKHPIGYKIDGFQKEDYDYVAQFIERINNLDEYEKKDNNK